MSVRQGLTSRPNRGLMRLLNNSRASLCRIVFLQCVERSRDNGDSPRGGKDNEAGGSSNEKAVRKHERSPSVENGNDNDPEEKEGASRSRSPTRSPST